MKISILAFPTIFLLFFFIFPLVRILTLAFSINMEENTLFSINNLIKVLSHPLNQYFLYWDIQQAFLTTILCILIGLPGSYILAHYRFPGKSLLRNLLIIPFILPPIVVLIGFIAVFGHGSLLNQIWKDWTGFILIDIYNTYEGIILAHVFYNIPVIIRLTEIGWQTIDPELIAVAKSLKASRWRIFWQVQFPQLLPILAAASLLVFIYSFNSFAIVLVLGGVQYQTIEVRIYSLAKGQFDFNGAAALTVVQLLINIIIILLYLYFTSRYELPTTKSTWSVEKPLFTSTRKIESILRPITVISYFLIVAFICIFPIVGVFIGSLTDSNGALTLSNYAQLFDVSIKSFIGIPPQAMIVNTLFFGLGVMILASVLALLLNQGLNFDTTYKGTPRLSLLTSVSGIIVILPLAVSSITLAFSLFSLYRLTPLYKDISFAVIIAQTLVAFPFANRIIAATRANFDPTIVNVARSLGASRIRTFFKIEFPLLLPGIIVAGLFSFAISIGEFGATNFLARANFATIPIGIYRLVNTRNIGPAAAFAAILVIITMISFMIIEKLGRLELRF